MFLKLGQQFEITSASIQSAGSVLNDSDINERFLKFAKDLKKLAPKSEDFLYFSTRYITAAEAVLVNPDGSPKLDRYGKPIEAHWEKGSKGSMKWICSDTSIKPFKNANGDIFPEEELIKAHKKWIERPLCVDHKSDSVEAVRGIILDSYYDRVNKYAVALVALDKVSFPDLARGITGGYKTSVSMGTAVGKAICYDCGNVASTERDFCQHMRSKSCYGEVNIDLNPIEISLVVNGADPTAKIRTILAAANHLRQNLDAKQNELQKLALEPEASTKFRELEEDLKKIAEKLAELKTSLEKEDTNQADAPYGNTGDLAMKEPYDLPNTDQSLQFPARLASHNNALVVSELQELKTSIKEMEKSLSNIKEELTMTANNQDGMNKKEAYFQGGGGANEPAPHQVKYPKDPMNERLRMEDKHMVGQHNLDTGPVDGMHPGPDSAGMSDEQRKEMLHRAEVEQRAMRRAAALKQAKEKLMETKAYFQGGGGVNEPAPGKVKYPADPLNEKDRNKEDKQMVGQKPFPGVGDVEGLHPSPLSADEKDELVRKQKMNRAEDASLRAKFHRVAGLDGNQDMGKSGWQVFQDGQLVFTASVNEISGGNVDKLYDLIATKEFGTKLLEKIRTVGVEKTASLYKSAQAVTGMGAQPAAPADMGGAAPIPPMADMTGAGIPQPGAPEPAMEAPKDMGQEGDPKAVALKLAERMRDDASDLLEAVRVLTGEQAEMGELEGLTEKSASQDVKRLMKMKKTLNAALISGMKKTADALNEHQEEMALITDILNDGSIKTDYTNTIVEEALVDAKAVLADVAKLKQAFIKYAHGSEQLEKQAQAKPQDLISNLAKDPGARPLAGPEVHKDDDMSYDMDMGMDDDMKDMDMDDDMPADLLDEEKEEHKEDENDVKVDLPGGKGMVEVPAGATVHSASLDTKEARAEMRVKLAAQSVEFSEMLDKAHALADGQTQLDVKPSDNLGRVETVNEQHAAFLEVAEAPPKVRKEAERLNQFIVQGKVSEKDLDKLVAQGLDPEVVKYWKQFYGQAGKEGSEFASGMLKEHAKAQFDETVNNHKVKLSRAYELTNEMVRRGLLADDRIVIAKYVDDVMTWNDEGFEAMKRMISKQPMKKSAAVLPQIGLIDSTEAARSEMSFQDALDRAFAGRKY